MAAVMKTATAIGSVASFWSPKPAAIKSLKVYFEPKQAGEGDPSPDNVRPIEGWNGVEVTHCKEIVPKTGWEVTRSYRTIKIDGDYRFYFKFIEKDSTVELPSNLSFGVALVYPRDGGEAGKGYNWAIEKRVFKTEQSNKITYPKVEVGKNGMYLMIYPSSQEAFDAFFAKYEVQIARDTGEPQTYTSSWESEVGTVYGGYVDLISGELTVTKAKYTLTGSEADEIAYNTTQNDPSGVERHYYWAKALDRVYVNNSSSTVLSNIGIGYIQSNREKKPPILIYVGTPSRQVGVYVTSSICEPTVESFCDYLNEHNIEIVNTLLNPVTHQLTPQQLSAFIGRNNFFSNATKVEVEYEYADSPELEAIKKRIVLNEPHISNASGSVASFYTDMASPMKSLRVNFEAKQSGTGNPSPDNVRPITGMDQINVYRTGKNLCHIVGYSAKTHSTLLANRTTSNDYGTSITTINYTSPDTPLVVTQSSYDESKAPNHYNNGFFALMLDSLVFGQTYNVSFRITDILSNPLNVSPSIINIGTPSGYEQRPTEVQGDKIIYKNVKYDKSKSHDAQYFFIRCCGMSYTMSEFMVTEATEEDQTFEPFQWNMIPCSFSELGTQYGGYVDLVNGTLTKTYGFIHADESSRWYASSATTKSPYRYYISQVQPSNGKYEPVVSDKFAPYSGWDPYPFYMVLNNGGHLVVGAPEELSTLEAFKSWLQEVGGTDVVYPLAESVTYQLTSQQIKTLRGTNNVYSKEGTSAEVAYWLHNDQKVTRKTVVWNNKCNGYISDADWKDRNTDETHTTFEDGVATIDFYNSPGSFHTMVQKVSPPVSTNSTYYMSYWFKPNKAMDGTGIVGAEFGGGAQIYTYLIAEPEVWYHISVMAKGRRDTTGAAYIPFVSSGSVSGLIAQVKSPVYIDLTLMFGAGNEPATVEEFEHLCAINGVDLTKPQAYDEGTECSWIIN